MEVPSEPKSWRDELASLLEDTGIVFNGDSVLAPPEEFLTKSPPPPPAAAESLRVQIKGFAVAWGELLVELARGCRDVARQSLLAEDSYIVRKTRGPLAEVSGKLRFLNEFLPEDRHPAHVWPVILFVFFLALAVLSVNSKHEATVSLVKKVSLHPPSAARILLPDGRYIAYHETGVPSLKARFTVIIPHGFLSSRLAGVPGIKIQLLEEFGVRLITYDLPGFGESDPHPNRTLGSSALDMLHLSHSVGVRGKFWVLGYSGGSLHTWAALKYIPDNVAGAIMFAPLVNPYDLGMTKEEMSGAWGNWTRRKRLLYFLARRFPKFLPYFYRRTFLSGKHGPVDKWLASSLGKKDRDLVKTTAFEEIWQRDVEESIRLNNPKPFVEEAVLQVTDWGFKLVDLQVRKKCTRKGIIPWLQFMYGQPECELTGYLGPIHIWQGMDDMVVPPSMTDYVGRVLQTAVVHRLPNEGHFSYFSFCDECHRQILSTVFGSPQGPIDTVDKKKNTLTEGNLQEASDN
ncbi:alpha/beta-Hydrolases superfamily protein [Striga hermonthica]|uniref:Alpha/beta-Hydrolases superfamily protein n=1 Tax=Striga hermonthica TaxID=68872 RepID=A0A9N7RMT1_STRHE|nr:alpha/beta-Hydrolases superfamily protein [Striga hermonthica]